MLDNYSGLYYTDFEVIEDDLYGNWYNKLQMYDKFRDGENLYFDLDRFKNSSYDISLKDEDSLYIPSINDTISVVGEVLNQNTFVYDRDLDAKDYLEKAGGVTSLADTDFIYIVKANGEARRVKTDYFWGTSNDVFKGDTIVVPMKLDTISDITFAKDVSSIVYQLAVTAASLKTVGGL